MIKFLGISGSLRAAIGLLRAAEAFAADALKIDAATLHGMPRYEASHIRESR